MMDVRFLQIIADTLGIASDQLKEDSTAETVPEWDSLNHWTVIGKLEQVYGVEFTLDEATEFKNLGHIYEILMSKL